ncbi:hypothetical protein J4P02_29880 [Pseudomonas sp. NFXW11]|uniref:hypothetical protein n=1 Tax=Pseudomonas sp. NFXW11 TaxID=2819531 RepID=UPI003CE7532B
MNEFQELERQFYEIQPKSDNYLREFLSNAKVEVVRKIISKGALFNLRLFEIQRAGFEVGKELKVLPKSIKNTHVYYFDGDDKVVMMEVYGQSESVVNKEFFFYGEGRIKSMYFDSGGAVRNIATSTVVDGKVLQDVNFGKYGCSVSDYLYEDAELKSISVRQKQHDQEVFSTYQVLFEYLDGKVVKVVNLFPNGYQELRYP